ncbi:hypothetical protein Zm00014a_028694 [Zea mays]|uniref:Uncharacterized protein n=1 Tax=Zea mays TaxID=4577 RepID=A0A3L6FIA2_MAIZE|nr:hypothetical protein Zm00014a_028694 [Zea mays]
MFSSPLCLAISCAIFVLLSLYSYICTLHLI